MKASVIAAMLMATALLSGCNKDDVIEDPDLPPTSHYRPATATSSPRCNKVYKWMPAPGQFINETAADGTPWSITSESEAIQWAMSRLDNGLFVSLGGFGGYIVVGFDHSVDAGKNDYDFGIAGNSYYVENTAAGGSNEPGIVYVMQDSNGNGLPDDTWYELRGSEYDRSTTRHNYSVTYSRPSAVAADVPWVDSDGTHGSVPYVEAFHRQDSYYPMWIKDDAYTLAGTCLAPRNEQQNDQGYWTNRPYPSGYADNMGSDNAAVGSFRQCNRFRIADAVDSKGQPAGLRYIDFIKVQTAVNASSGWLGEISTEVLGFVDLNL